MPSSENRKQMDIYLRLAVEIDNFEEYPHPHASRVAFLADEMAQSYRMPASDRLSLRSAALSHDIGELVMKRDYIKRAGPLTREERQDLARHPVIGEQEAAKAGMDRGAQLLVRWHHEWWNGTGYPDGLREWEIPLSARILRVVDSYAALTEARPYRQGLEEENARKYLREWAGLEFDPSAVKIFLSLGNDEGESNGAGAV